MTSGYLATLSATLILAGAAADRYGRRRIFIIGLVAFGITSALCGLAPTMELLVVSRLLQGVAGALLVPGPLSIITASFEGTARARAFGLWSAATSALTIVGPLVGAFLVDSLSWRVAFLVNVPLVLVALYAAVRHVPESRNEGAARRLDWLGSAVIAIAVGGISFGLIRGQEQHWSDPTALLILAVGVVAAVAFPIMMLKRRDPLVPPALFRIRAFTVINISTFLIYGALYTSSFLQSVYLQGVLGYTALGAAAISLPAGILLTLFSTRVGVLAARVGAWPFLVIGPLLMAAGMFWLSRIPATSEPWQPQLGAGLTLPPASTFTDVLPSVVLFGIGITLVVAPLTTTLMGSVPVANAGLGIGHQQCGLTGGSAAAARAHLPRPHERLLRRAGGPRPRTRHLVGGRPVGVPAAQPARHQARTRRRPWRSVRRRPMPSGSPSSSTPSCCSRARWSTGWGCDGAPPSRRRPALSPAARADTPGRGR